MNKKLRSDNGASIIFALLIFLLCAVVASVVLAAATAAVGRIGGITEMDSRYYSVTSAAELFREALDEEGPVTVVRTKTTTTTTKTTYTNTEDGAVPAGGPVVSEAYDFAAELDAVPLSRSAQATLLQKMALFMVFGDDSGIDVENTWERGVFDPAVRHTFALELELRSDELDGDTLAALAVHISGTLREDGTLELVFSNANGADQYAVVMTFAADVEQSSLEEISVDAPVIQRDEASGSFTETETETAVETKIARICWIMTGMEKVVASHEAS